MNSREKQEYRTDDEKREYQTGIVVQLVSRMMCLFIIMFGVYLIVHGHLTPGGGFQGGVVIGSAFILFALAFNKEEGRAAAPAFSLKCLASAGIYIYMASGLAGIFVGYYFLANKVAGVLPRGMLGELFSGGTLFWINIGVGLAVASVSTELFYAFLEEKPDDTAPKNKKELPYKRRWSDVDKDDHC